MPSLPQSQTLTPHLVNGVGYYTFPSFDELPFLRHGFSTRLGGVSRGIYESMDLSFTRGDDEDSVRENFRRFAEAIGGSPEQIVVSAQEHHTTVYHATAADRGRGVTRERGYTDVDGLLTDEADVLLCTQYADCTPLFFVDPVRRVCGMSHAGWKGTVQKIGAVTIEKMRHDFGCDPADVLCGIGPSIGRCCFEVDTPVRERFETLSVFDGGCFDRVSEEKVNIDLWEVNRRILEEAGVLPEHITVGDLCTKCHADVFWSHRATGGQRGSLAGFIAIKE